MMRRALLVVLSVCAAFMCGRAVADEHEKHAKLPAGPIHDRHELMEGIGRHAKTLGQAVKAGDKKTVGVEAEAIAAESKKITALFPPGSTHPDSRAKPEIWKDWAKFEAGAANMEKEATALAKVAGEGGDVDAASKRLFGACKSCHDAFRVPED
jgi:cytochrome c556